MYGAQAMIRTLVDAGVDTCFTNPGTSEMHFVAALDDVPEMRGVLCLFEGVATGAADGWARMTGRPAATLLHLGPGLGNGVANLHNARRAGTPMVNIVGDHATYHLEYDAPLNGDIDTIARNFSRWIGRPATPAELAPVTADAVAAAHGPPADIATLVLPADVSWSDGAEPAAPHAERSPTAVGDDVIDAVAAVLRSGEPAVLFLGGHALFRPHLQSAARVAAGTRARLMGATFVGRTERGAGIPAVERLAYFAEMAAAQLDGVRHLILVDAKSPVSFFAYPGKPSDLVPEGCSVHVLSGPGEDSADALARLADRVGAEPTISTTVVRPEVPPGPLTNRSIAAAVAAVIPEHAIICDESATASVNVAEATAGVPAHDYLQLTGGAIGQGLPLAVGAAVACPDRPVFAFESDGSAMYTLQALWTMAREQLDITTIIFNNRAYAILQIELARTGAGEGGPKARALFDLSRPDLDFVQLAQGMGVPAVAVSTTEELTAALERAAAEPGPHLIDALVTR